MEFVEQLSERGSRNQVSIDDESEASCSQSPEYSCEFVMKFVSESLVVPATTVEHPKWLPLTNLDRVVNPTFISVIFFYENVLSENGHGKTFEDVTASLKESLAKVLVEFYPLAGRLTWKEDALMDLQCNDAGAIFTESSVNLKLSQLGGPQPMPILSGMAILDNVAKMGSCLVYLPDQVTPEIPVLVINVTKFSCGSIALAANWHHTVADGFSGCHFMRSWAELATGQVLSLLPSHERRLLKPRSPLDSSLMCKGNYVTTRLKFEPTIQAPLRHSEPRVVVPFPVVKPFILTKCTIQQLKENVNRNREVGASSSNNSPFTSTETVSAELWKLMTKARSSNDEEARKDRSRFFTFVDGRKRLGLAPGYFGNVVCSVCAESNPDELLRRPLSYAASLISNATRAVDNEYFRSLIDWVEEMGITSSHCCRSQHVDSTGFDVAATFWVFLPLYEINFGWGKPILSVRNAPPRKFIDGISMMPSPDGQGNMLALLNLHVDRMDKLEQDPDFKQTAKPLHMKESGPVRRHARKSFLTTITCCDP